MPFIEEEIKKLKTWLIRQGYAEQTIKGYINDFKYFFRWLENNKIGLEKLNQNHINKYYKYILKLKVKKSSIQERLNTIKLYDKYLQLTKNKKILYKNLKIIETELPTKREILTIEEIKKLYDEIEESLLGYRDKAILSLCYGCGLRKREIERLESKDICYESSLLHVKPGKNYENRFIPMSSGVVKDLKDYEKYSRPYLAFVYIKEFIVGINGKAINGENMRNRVKILVEKSRINKNISLHNLRHSIATHLLEKGMSLEQIGLFLGHKSLDSTQIYTHMIENMSFRTK
ncbi:MAG: tyrosine-type recombinase/integrase [Bacteroidetes bacterium]|nr:tyrosine-type recombinase/integrase [Bacteroidota bacterium]